MDSRRRNGELIVAVFCFYCQQAALTFGGCYSANRSDRFGTSNSSNYGWRWSGCWSELPWFDIVSGYVSHKKKYNRKCVTHFSLRRVKALNDRLTVTHWCKYCSWRSFYSRPSLFFPGLKTSLRPIKGRCHSTTFCQGLRCVSNPIKVPNKP